MKKILISVACVFQVAVIYSAAADRQFVSPADVVVRVNSNKAKDLSKEKAMYISGKSVSDPRVADHEMVFSGFATAFKLGAISCATILYNDTVAGVMFYCADDNEKGCYELQYLVIGKEYQGKGIGTCALTCLEQLVKPKKMVLTALEGTEKFYQNMGFEETKDAQGSAIWMKKYA